MGQILNISVKRLLPKVTLLSAGETQQVVCTPMVYLSAPFEGDLNRHTTEWEQIEGIPLVTLISVDATNSYYVVSDPPGSDKVFRFWIDKGRSYQQYADITIRTTPTDDIAVDLNYGSLPVPLAVRDSFKVVQTLLMGNLVFDESIPFNSAGDTFTNNFILSWNLPKLYKETLDSETQRYANNFVGTVLQNFNSSSWETIYTALGLQLREFILPTANKLRINSLYIYNGQISTIEGDWFSIDASTTKVITAKEVIPDVKLGIVDNSATITRLIYTLNLQTFDTTVNNPMTFMPASNQTTVNQIVYTLNPIDADTTLEPLISATAVNLTYSITRVTTGTIGG